MNETILSSLLNLFALFGSRDQTDREKSAKVLSSYLAHHFGVRNVENYLELYHDLRDFYDDMPELDVDVTISGMCAKLITQISNEEQTLMLLRLMEFCSIDGQDWNNDGLFRIIVREFQIKERIYDDMVAFLDNTRESKRVKTIHVNGVEGYIKTLYLKPFQMVVFACHSQEEFMMNDVPVMPHVSQIWQRSGVLKCAKATPIYYYQALSAFVIKKQREPIVLEGKNVNFRYSATNENGTHNLTFKLYSGSFVAVMGGSGAGKSTLLSILNGTLQPQEGQITLNGHAITEPAAKALIGYVPQDDLLIEELTVFQNLWFTGKLCFEGMPDKELEEKVNAVLEDLGLTPARDLKVGSPVHNYISGGQRKRLNIALELIREPAVLFLDEPTSGLSSADAEMIVNLLKELAFRGQLVVANIHQPSSDIFKLFDKLWMLDRGGYPIYFGNPIEAITYFKSAANYADAETSMCPVCGNVNPEVILHIIEENALDDAGKPTTKRKVSPLEWHERFRKHVKNEKEDEDEDKRAIPATEQRKPNAFKQVLIYLQRNFKMKLTNVQYMLITLLEAPLLALICAGLTHYAPLEGYSVLENSNMVSYYFMAIIVAIFLGMSGSAEEIIKDRALRKREKFLNLSYKSYIWSKIIFMGVVMLVQTLLFILVGNAIMEIHGLFGVWWLILFAAAFLAGLTGLWLSQTLNSVVAIYITIPLLLIPQILLCGLVVKFSDLNPRSTTGNVPLVGDVIPSRWAFEALAVTSFSDNLYERNFFEAEREKYELQYYHYAFAKEMESQLESYRVETKNNIEPPYDRMEVLTNEMPRLAAFAQIQPYQGSGDYDSWKTWIQDAKHALSHRSNAVTLRLDRQVSAMIHSQGKEAIKHLKRDNYNLNLEQLVVNLGAPNLCKVVEGHIVPQAGFIFLAPESPCGRAPFYASQKYIGATPVKTLWFNLAVLLFMSICASLCLFFEIPSRWIHKTHR